MHVDDEFERAYHDTKTTDATRNYLITPTAPVSKKQGINQKCTITC